MSAPERPRTGMAALKSKVKLRGLSVLDKRTNAARALLGWRSELIDALGGEGTVTPQQRRLVELATRASMYCDHADAILMERNSLVNRRGKMIPLVAQRTLLADHVVAILSKLGLERRRPPALDIALEIQRQRAENGPPRAPTLPAAAPRGNGLAHAETVAPEGLTAPTAAVETEGAGASPSAHAAL
jgi:hypothetical protein